MSNRATYAIVIRVLAALFVVSRQEQLGIIQETSNKGWEYAKIRPN